MDKHHKISEVIENQSVRNFTTNFTNAHEVIELVRGFPFSDSDLVNAISLALDIKILHLSFITDHARRDSENGHEYFQG
jgi:hypothetical protein